MWIVVIYLKLPSELWARLTTSSAGNRMRLMGMLAEKLYKPFSISWQCLGLLVVLAKTVIETVDLVIFPEIFTDLVSWCLCSLGDELYQKRQGVVVIKRHYGRQTTASSFGISRAVISIHRQYLNLSSSLSNKVLILQLNPILTKTQVRYFVYFAFILAF